MKTLLVLLSVGLAAAVLAQTAVEIQSVRGYPGQTATVPFTVRKATNVVAAQFDLAYAPGHGSLRDPELAARFTNHVLRSREIAPGVRRVLVYSRNNALLRTNGFTGSFAVDIPAAERVGSGPLTPQNVVLARADGTAITPVSAKSGTVFVTPVYRDPASGVVDLFFPSASNERYFLQTTTDFARWEIIATNVAAGDFMDWVDVDAPRFPHRFYRTALADAFGQVNEARVLADGRFSFRAAGLEGRSYTVQVSTNLTTWADVATLVASGGALSFTNAAGAAAPARFFRLKSAP